MKLLKYVIHFSEFYKDPTTGEQKNGTCTDTSATVCMIGVDGKLVSADVAGKRMLALADDMYQHHLGALNGAATVMNMGTEMQSKGYKLALLLPFQHPQMAFWKTLLKDYAGERPILLQVANGKALRDMLTNSRPECLTLQYHAIAIVGIDDSGAYLCVDGDNPEVTERFQTYSEADIELAQPCGMIIFDMKETPMQLPTYAHDDGQTIHYDGTNNTVSGGFRKAMLSGVTPWLGMVRTPELDVDDIRMNGTMVKGRIQFFMYGVMCADLATHQVYALQAGDLLLALAMNKSNPIALTNLGVK